MLHKVVESVVPFVIWYSLWHTADFLMGLLGIK